MNLKGKIAIVATAAILGGYGLAYAEGYPNPTQDTYASETATQTAPAQPETSPSTPVDTATVSTNANETTPSVDIIPPQVNETPAAKPVPKPIPAPKPAVVYSTTHSADTPCRLYTEAVYTNDCGTPAPQPATQTAPAETPAPTDPQPASDPSQTVVSNPNQ